MTMTDGARRVAAGFAATGGVARGADLIEQRVLSRSRTSRISRYVTITKRMHRLATPDTPITL
jgi:hypothetical protein